MTQSGVRDINDYDSLVEKAFQSNASNYKPKVIKKSSAIYQRLNKSFSSLQQYQEQIDIVKSTKNIDIELKVKLRNTSDSKRCLQQFATSLNVYKRKRMFFKEQKNQFYLPKTQFCKEKLMNKEDQQIKSHKFEYSNCNNSKEEYQYPKQENKNWEQFSLNNSNQAILEKTNQKCNAQNPNKNNKQKKLQEGVKTIKKKVYDDQSQQQANLETRGNQSNKQYSSNITPKSKQIKTIQQHWEKNNEKIEHQNYPQVKDYTLVKTKDDFEIHQNKQVLEKSYLKSICELNKSLQQDSFIKKRRIFESGIYLTTCPYKKKQKTLNQHYTKSVQNIEVPSSIYSRWKTEQIQQEIIVEEI